MRMPNFENIFAEGRNLAKAFLQREVFREYVRKATVSDRAGSILRATKRQMEG